MRIPLPFKTFFRFFEPRNTLDPGGNLFLSVGNRDALYQDTNTLYYVKFVSICYILRNCYCNRCCVIKATYNIYKITYNIDLVNKFQFEYIILYVL